MGWSNKRHRLLVVWTLRSAAVLAVITLGVVLTRDPGEKEVKPGDSVAGLTSVLSRGPGPLDAPIRFVDVTAASGIDFRHFPDQRESLLPEDMGSGIACGDYDGDGKPDLYFVNFAGSVTDPLPDAKAAPTARCRLYRNLGGMRFEDVTDRAGVGLVAFANGAAFGDYDNDGDLDLYVTAFGQNTLFQNLGDGTFKNVTEAAGVQDSRYSTGCAWADVDRDGHLDLYVSNYVDFVLRPGDRGRVKRQYASEQPYTLNPSAYAPQGNSLFRNNGDGSFDEVAAAVGVADPTGRSLSACWADLDNDGWVDLYVANDVSNNGVFRNVGDGTFVDIGPQSLAADYRGAMGIAVADFDDDLDQDLLITHWVAQENALYRNMFLDAMMAPDEQGSLMFLDSADELGLGQQSLDRVGWGTGFADLDNDGRADVSGLGADVGVHVLDDGVALLLAGRDTGVRLSADDVVATLVGIAGHNGTHRGRRHVHIFRPGESRRCPKLHDRPAA
ncbi:MAG: VCBS repeat-containing protein, partial [Planctomycetes bacterium]|nr:VCBS repeat-containing protein [Planctomycetota bacterium]